jgi:hypothetical protein
MIGLACGRMVDMEVEVLTGATHRERSPITPPTSGIGLTAMMIQKVYVQDMSTRSVDATRQDRMDDLRACTKRLTKRVKMSV